MNMQAEFMTAGVFSAGVAQKSPAEHNPPHLDWPSGV